MRFRLARHRTQLSDGPLFADSARMAVDLAGSEAARLRHEYVGTEHLTLGLLRPDTRGYALLRSLGAKPDELRASIEAKCPVGRERAQNLPYTSRAKKVLDLAIIEATKAQVVSVEVEYLVLGLLLEERGIGAQLLTREAGITVDAVRRAILNPAAALFKVALSDASDASLMEQIVAQIEEGIATGHLKPGDKLQTVRSLADELQIAPGTVARAYTELERRGAVRTDGSRGTTVAERVSTAMNVGERVMMLSAMLRPVAVEGFHLGATADELREAMERAINGVKL